MESDRTLSYWIDSSGTVLRIVGPWDTWLNLDGEIPERSRRNNVVGQNLFSYVKGEGVGSVYREMHALVFKTGRPLEFPFRCDSNWLRREMRMRISLDGDTLRYDSTIIRETRRERPLPWPAAGANTFVAICSFCKAYRFPIESPVWKDIEFLLAERDLPEDFSVTHGLCNACSILWLREP